MATFLLEIGTEELPADFARDALAQLARQVEADLQDDRLHFEAVQAVGTPRRLGVLVHGLADAQEDLTEERKGPPAAQAFVNGEPGPAAIGFARRCGVAPEALEVRDSGRGAFVYATTRRAGSPAAAVLQQRIPAWIWGLQGRRFMRWGSGDSRFSRPLRWLVALLDGQVLPLTLDSCDPPLVSDRLSQGHRLSRRQVSLAHADTYLSSLEAAGVQVDREQRRRGISGLIAQAAQAAGATADLPEGLLQELVDLVEAPQLIEGVIEPQFLALPAEVLSTVMRSHQRYVPLLQSGAAADPLALQAEGILLPRFLCIADGLPEALATIRRGNERVLRARLADARFFVEQDRATPSIDRRERLATVTFAEGLGSLRDRCDRLEWVTDVLLEQLLPGEALSEHCRRAAHLCKHDLVSQMVGEFPELQGVMGAKYLLAEGERREVALAVLEHYLPRGAGDALPASLPGAVVAVAERLELLVSIFARGERPSGSSDPYALRRAGNGLLQIIWQQGWPLDVHSLLARAAQQWASWFPAFGIDPAALATDLGDFLRQRIASLLEEDGVDPDLVQAVAGDSDDLERLLRDPDDARQRAALLRRLRQQGELAAIQAVVQRAARLAEKGELSRAVVAPAGVIEAALFSSVSETAMLRVLQDLEPIVIGKAADRYEQLAGRLKESAATLSAFFDGADSVLVMAEDAAVRRNRLALLAVLRNQAAVLADFSRING
ncbi:MAG: glycine--tRNA ligase subunit beta [Synechococcaceae cyanobacterium]|nr:glycine--tRNA ligase subunit beta [Synechococcaceae cyanobacterium]